MKQEDLREIADELRDLGKWLVTTADPDLQDAKDTLHELELRVLQVAIAVRGDG